ncbi:hypothetical protein IscW_ISCW012828 [Ixodes scapularis]|uniref:Uncharacterized protein n=1 Tax=Ixodes scapularis TaxID=6945 RepID=B7QEI7_IXOSC|nr:hypothetical protein IscW_ISCW012828 [Ixodes scapularis]|eukprot:XP_002413951.1 hypothetical protein IscW_ISCW012828 [Ixodes scapularis]
MHDHCVAQKRAKVSRRLALFPTSKIVPHIPDESVPWWDPRWKEPPGQLCSSSFFVEPTGWLFHQAQSLQGKRNKTAIFIVVNFL